MYRIKLHPDSIQQVSHSVRDLSGTLIQSQIILYAACQVQNRVDILSVHQQKAKRRNLLVIKI